MTSPPRALTPQATPASTAAAQATRHIAALPAETRQAFEVAYALNGYDSQELAMSRLLYEISTRPYYVPDNEVPDPADERFLIDRFPMGLSGDDYSYLSTLMGVDTGWPVLRSQVAVTSVIGSPVYSCFRDARIYSPFVFLTDGEITSYEKCVQSGKAIILAPSSVSGAATTNASIFADRILSCLSPSLPPVPSMMLVLVPQATSVTDLAEFANLRQQFAADGKVYDDHRGVAAYGTAAIGEENVLDLSADVDKYGLKVGQIVVHEIAHLIMDSNPTLTDVARAIYDSSVGRGGLWQGTYEALNPQEFFAVLTTDMFGLGFDSPGTDTAGLRIIGVNGPQQLKDYDPDAYAFLSKTYTCIPPAP